MNNSVKGVQKNGLHTLLNFSRKDYYLSGDMKAGIPGS